MNLIHYIAREAYRGLTTFLHPENTNCWLKVQTHDWGHCDEPRWSCKECNQCGRHVEGCGI